jgi:hypothetical protein
MKTFRMYLGVLVMGAAVVVVMLIPESLISPIGFCKAIGVLFVAAAFVGFTWPDIPDPDAEED